MFRMRLPRTPTHAPTASTFESIDDTAIFVRKPASRAIALISMTRSATSGTSASNSRRMKSGWLRERTILTWLPVLAHVEDQAAHAVAGMELLAGDLLGAAA